MINLDTIASVQETVTSGALLIAIPLAILAGLVSFASPCVLPLVPGYLSYITGLTGAELAGEVEAGEAEPGDGKTVSAKTGLAKYGRVLLGTSLFIFGFSIVFVAFGFLFGAFGQWFVEHTRLIQGVLGILVIILGLMFGGWIPGLNREYRFHMAPKYGLWGAPLLGIVFGLGWVPCIGPTLSAVLTLAYSEGSAARGALLAFAYCLGLGIPFLLIGLAFNKAAVTMAWIRQHYQLIMRLGGALLVLIGILLVTGIWGTVVKNMQTWISTYDLPL